MRPLLSIIMPTFNGEQYVAAALSSVLQQSDETIELVVVDDGSTDDTLAIVRSFADKLPLRIFTPQRLGNWVAASNLGLREAVGEWACFLHQDDLWLPGKLPAMQRAVRSAQGRLILHHAMFVDPQGRSVGRWSCPLSAGLVPSALFLERLLVQNFIAIPSPVFRRSAVIESGALNEALWFSADWDLWLRLGAMGPVWFVAETLSAFRIHPASQTAARKVGETEWDQQLTSVLQEHLAIWPGTRGLRKAVGRVARLSIAVNSALAGASRGMPVRWSRVLWMLIVLGPGGWWRYLRDSRILQRVGPRLRVQRERGRATM